MTANTAPTILVVDDDPRSLELLQRVLQPAGYRVVVAPDGGTAIEILATESPSLALVDLRMPGMTGLEFCARVRALGRASSPRVVLLTGADDEDTRQAARAAGASDVVTKPFDRADLLARIAAAVAPTR